MKEKLFYGSKSSIWASLVIFWKIGCSGHRLCQTATVHGGDPFWVVSSVFDSDSTVMDEVSVVKTSRYGRFLRELSF